MTDQSRGLAGVFDDHLAAEFATRDVNATMATMADDPYVVHVPVLIGGNGRDGVRQFYDRVFIGHWPEDTTMEHVSRTVGVDHVVDELVLSFTHDIAMDHLLPGVPPTGRPVRMAVCVVAGFRDGKVTHEHVYWDQASVLVQVGLLEPGGLPVTGAEQAAKLLAPRSVAVNVLLGPDSSAGP
jgi:carboxymethylenebutenolidase